MGWAAWRTAFSSLAARIMLTKHLENNKALFSVDADMMSFTIFKSVLILDCQYTRCNSVACDVSLNFGNSFAL